MPLFYNKATLSYNNKVTDSNIVTGELLEVLNATKTAIGTEYREGDSVTYIISMINSGNTAYNGLIITDDLGNADVPANAPLTYEEDSLRYYVNGTLQQTPIATAGAPLVISGISVPAGGNAQIIYKADINTFAPLEAGSSIINQATISGNGLMAPVVVEETINAANTANLTISKSLCPESVVENGQITYTFVIQNSGNSAATAADNVIVTDVFQPVLNPITVTFNDNVWTSPTNYTYNTATGEFATVAGQITVPAATYTQDAQTGVWTIIPGISVLKIVGTVTTNTVDASGIE